MSYRDVTGALDSLIRTISKARSLEEVTNGTVMAHAIDMVNRAKGGLANEVPWTTFETMTAPLPSPAQIEQLLEANPTWTESRAHVEFGRWCQEETIYLNSRYQVRRKEIAPGYLHFAISRRDGLPVSSWTDVQRIKSELVGPECEAVELFPGASRNVATGEVTHLWINGDPNYRFPVGFSPPPQDVAPPATDAAADQLVN